MYSPNARIVSRLENGELPNLARQTQWTKSKHAARTSNQILPLKWSEGYTDVQQIRVEQGGNVEETSSTFPIVLPTGYTPPRMAREASLDIRQVGMIEGNTTFHFSPY